MDIIEKLRLVDIQFWWKPLGHGIDTDLDVPAYELGALSHEAANEIERLRKEVEEKDKRIEQYLGSIGYYVTKSVLQDHGLWQLEDEQ